MVAGGTGSVLRPPVAGAFSSKSVVGSGAEAAIVTAAQWQLHYELSTVTVPDTKGNGKSAKYTRAGWAHLASVSQPSQCPTHKFLNLPPHTWTEQRWGTAWDGWGKMQTGASRKPSLFLRLGVTIFSFELISLNTEQQLDCIYVHLPQSEALRGWEPE